MSSLAANSHLLCREIGHNSSSSREQQTWNGGCLLFQRTNTHWLDGRNKSSLSKIDKKRDLIRAQAFSQDTRNPTSIEMEPISDSEHLDQILLQAKDLNRLVLIDWMASWCRKCIYLKPKLEKLAAEFDTKAKFYCVDVNKVPQSLVKRGNVPRMPTIQLWKDGEMKAEVIGGHQALLVIDEVREMIRKFV